MVRVSLSDALHTGSNPSGHSAQRHAQSEHVELRATQGSAPKRLGPQPEEAGFCSAKRGEGVQSWRSWSQSRRRWGRERRSCCRRDGPTPPSPASRPTSRHAIPTRVPPSGLRVCWSEMSSRSEAEFRIRLSFAVGLLRGAAPAGSSQFDRRTVKRDSLS